MVNAIQYRPNQLNYGNQILLSKVLINIKNRIMRTTFFVRMILVSINMTKTLIHIKKHIMRTNVDKIKSKLLTWKVFREKKYRSKFV